MRFSVLIFALASLNFYAVSRILFRWPWALAHPGIAWTGALVFFLLQVACPFVGRRFFSARKKSGVFTLILNWASYGAFGLMSLLVMYGFATDLVNLGWKFASLPSETARIDWLTFVILAAVTGASIIIGVGQAHMGPAIVRVDVPLKNLPEAFEGFTIAQVSDLHVGPTIRRRYTQKVVNIVNGLKPDLIALTGDFIDGTVHELAPHVAPLADLRAPKGIFFVTGNHEYYWNGPSWIEEFKRLGARVLMNEHEVIHRHGGAIVIAGVTDYSTRGTGWREASSPQKALEGAPQGLPKILLAHQPASYHEAQKAGADLQLSGHSHAGQYFPFSLVIRFFQRFYKGLNRHENLWVYVNKGTGYWGPPLRLGVPAEITLITLRREKA
jgi:uncharacterized protein